jgi:Xaa-Pro aminopeptidase
MKDKELVEEKLNQATQILREYDVDLWLTFARETVTMPDPILELILGFSVTWHSALILTQSGRKVAIVGRYEADSVRNLELYDDVIGYDKGIKRHLLSTLDSINPRKIAINYSQSDVAADGLSHGNFLTLNSYLEGTSYSNRLISAERIISALRGRKTPLEIERVKGAIEVTESIFDQVDVSVKPGMTQRQIASIFQGYIENRGFGYAWDKLHNPIVTCGPDSAIGHTVPGDIPLEQGHTLHIDFGVKVDDYCSDIQRMWYVLEDGETDAPDDVQHAFNVVFGALKAGEKVLKPGVQGWQVDAAARQFVVDGGYPEFMHAFGHLLGRSAHDGATILGPLWEKYDGLADRSVEAGNIFTLELHVPVPGRGIMSLEEDILVTDNGVEYLTHPQDQLRYIKS